MPPKYKRAGHVEVPHRAPCGNFATMHMRVALAAMAILPLAGMAQSAVGSAGRSDTVNVLHTRIALDLTHAAEGGFSGTATLRFTPSVNGVQQVYWDLIPSVDSVWMESGPLAFAQSGQVLTAQLPYPAAPGDTLELSMAYSGTPPVDGSGFGGFYLSGIYQYNLGVAFQAVPHSYGRAWFPCFDNFRERSSFEFMVRVPAGHSVYANGELLGAEDQENGDILFHWSLQEPIPAYLASVASAPYVALRDTFPSVDGRMVPVILAAMPTDTARLRTSFQHLGQAFHTFEQWFGPYRWNRVGYVLTSVGAMEHATNICFPDFSVDGTLAHEDVMAHELAHHWFGNLITCASPEEMYISEGFSDFCAMLFLEALYGEEAYTQRVRKNHREVVAFGHLRDEGWFPLGAVPENRTYGETTYKKGADVARTLRAIMGDSLFAAAMQHVMQANAYSAMNSLQLRDSLSVASGLDLTDFFADWVLQPGGSAFMVDSVEVEPSGSGYAARIQVRQKTRGGAALFHQVPVTLACLDAHGARVEQLVVVGGETTVVELHLPFAPAVVRLNDDDRLALATTWDTLTLQGLGQNYLPNTDLRVSVTAFNGPGHLRVEEFWVPADPDPSGGHVVSPDRWWRVEADLPAGTDVSIRATLDGRPGFPGCFDLGLVQADAGMAFHENDLRILHRPGPGSAWAAMPATITTLGNATDGNARIEMPGLVSGDYALAKVAQPVATQEQMPQAEGWKYFPVPSNGRITVVPPDRYNCHGAELLIRDMQGKLVGRQTMHQGANVINLPRSGGRSLLLSERCNQGTERSIGPIQLIP